MKNLKVNITYIMYNIKFKVEQWVQIFTTEPMDLKPTVGVGAAFLFTA